MNANYKNKTFKQKGLVARVFASVIDAFSVLVATIIMAIISFPISNLIGLSDLGTYIQLVQYTSGLYIQNENGSMSKLADEEKFPQALYTYYVDVPLDGNVSEAVRGYSSILNPDKVEQDGAFNTPEDYYVFVLGKNDVDSPFDFSQPIAQSTPWVVAIKDGQAEQAKAYYQEAFNDALKDLEKFQPYREAGIKSDNFYFFTFVISFVIGGAIMIILVPVIDKDGVTLGKKFVGITIANNLGYHLTKLQAFFRGLNSFIFYYALFLLPISFVSMLILAINKEQKSLVDLIAGTIVLDKKNSVVYRDATEEKITNIHIAKKMVESRNRDEIYRAEERQKDKKI